MTKKTLIIIFSSIIGVIVIVLLIIWLLSIFKVTYYSYEEVESKMISATKSYYKTYPEKLPTQNGKTTLAYNTLVDANFIKPLNQMLKDGDKCSAEINVLKNDNNYDYIPKLNCSDKYSTKTLSEQVLNSNEVVNQGSGLYKDNNGGYYFRGKNINNYVVFENVKKKDTRYWQIIGLDENDNVRMLALTRAGKTSFDNRYNEYKKNNSGYNTFENSKMQDYLRELEKDETFLNDEQKSILIKNKLCIGSRNEEDTSKDGRAECSVLTNDEYLFATLLPYEYLRASLDNNCINTFSQSCENLNYLKNNEISFWTTTPNSTNTYQLYSFNSSRFDFSSAKNVKSVYPVITISSYATFKSGDGSYENPYILFKN